VTIRPGRAWGQPTAPPDHPLVVRRDVDLADAVARREPRPLLVRGGDVHIALGAPEGPATIRLALDVMHVEAIGFSGVAVAHVLVRRPGRRGWWHGPLAAVTNVDHVGAWDVAPRAHPGDGRLDVVEVAPTMSVRARWQAWRRLPTGTHVPHPDITARRVERAELAFPEPLGLWVDGVARGRASSVSVWLEPDAVDVYV
jgi:YegS C-terminal NAD kinase beta sandwich-like domain